MGCIMRARPIYSHDDDQALYSEQQVSRCALLMMKGSLLGVDLISLIHVISLGAVPLCLSACANVRLDRALRGRKRWGTPSIWKRILRDRKSTRLNSSHLGIS